MDGTYIVNGTRLTGLTVYSNAPVGTELIYLGSTAPIGWLVEDGSAISRTDYAALFSVIGTHYGSGDGSTTFNLPNKTAQDGIVLIKATEVASLESNAIDDSQTTGSNAWSAQKVNAALAGKQATLDTAQMAAVNSGVTSSFVNSFEYLESRTMTFTPNENGEYTWQHNKNHKYKNISLTPQSTVRFCQYDWDHSDKNNALFKIIDRLGNPHTSPFRVGILAID